MSDEIVPQSTMIDGVASTMDALVSRDGLISSTDSVAINDASIGHFVSLQDRFRSKLRRALDLVVAMILLVTMLPLGCLIVLLIATGGQHPFCSRRVIGQDGREFDCLKFKTLRNDTDKAPRQLRRDLEEPGPALALGAQSPPSVTHLGRVLRTTGLDELPQLINILLGDMSFVGPRPVAKDELAWLTNLPTTYLSVRPGLTGWYLARSRTPSLRS